MAIEFRKMHRLRSLPLLIGMVVAVAALSSASQFAGSTRAGFDDPARTRGPRSCSATRSWRR